jgi:PAS domain S-box-containing protein
MRLRIILMVLSILAVMSAAVGGTLYYSKVKEAALQEAERQAKMQLEMLTKSLSSFLFENTKNVRALAGMQEFVDLLRDGGARVVARTDALLDHFKAALEVDVIYVMNRRGITIASSNRNASDSFVGQYFGFRPYFRNAVQGWPTSYLALGITSNKRGVYNSYPIYAEPRTDPAGVMVIKSSIEVIENRLGLTSDDIVLVTDPRGVIFISNRGDWLLKLAWEVPPAEIEKIAAERQFGSGPWSTIGLQIKDNSREVKLGGERYLINQVEIENFPGWKVIHLRSLKAISGSVSGPFIRITGPIVLMLILLIGGLVFILYRSASGELHRRKQAEKALRDSEKRYRTLYHSTPAMLHSIDSEGRLVSVSNYWAAALGYTQEEIIGRRLTEFMTADSRRYAEQTVFPQFFKTGFCQDVPYRFFKKNGEVIDVLLSAIAERNADGDFVRTLAVSIDVTERKRAERALSRAQEELGRYTRDLERQVQLRTQEISGILKYTPAVVYFKDLAGRYLLVNSRYEELFGVCNAEVRGKTDAEIFPDEVAHQFRHGDREVLETRRSLQREVTIPHNEGLHTYLTVKFPVYGASGSIRGVCGIATDITAVKKAQEQLRRLSGNIMANQEKERTAIARELHDELGQVLTALRMDAVWLQDHLKQTDAEGARRALTMCRLIDKTIQDVRSIASRLRPGVLDDLGLVDALEVYTTDFEKRTGITCLFDHRDVPEITDTVATAAYRIAQEALTNVARHAAAGHVAVRLQVESGTLTLTVADDGCGFDAADLSETHVLGLAGMRERAVLAGGEVDIRSQPDHGTRVMFRVRLADSAPGSDRAVAI